MMRASGTDLSQIQRRQIGNGSRNQRISEAFYENSIEQDNQQEGESNRCRFPDLATSMHRSYNIKKYEIHQSRRLPHWVWYLLARFLGIKLHPLDRPIFGTLMIVLTVLFAITYIVSFIWYIAYDIVNEYTKQTVLTGVFSIVMVIYWASLGVYANKLAARLFSSQKFIDSVRLHSRTVFKVSAAGLMIIIAIASTILNNYTSATLYNGERCQNLTVSREVCYVMFGARLGYSIFSLIWNLLVGIVLLSVCRTHTIGIRRFIRQLEEDGHTYELYVRNMYNNVPVSQHSDTTQLGDDGVLVDIGQSDQLRQDKNIPGQSNTPIPPVAVDTSDSSVSQVGKKTSPPHPNRPIIIIKEGSVATMDEGEVELPNVAAMPPIDRLKLERTRASEDREIGAETPSTSNDKIQLINPDPPSYASRSTQHSLILLPSTSSLSLDQRSSMDQPSVGPNVLSPDNILLCYWRIGCRLRTTSIALQRWLIAWVCFILAWSLSFIVNWIHHEATMIEIAAFILPIMLLPLVCSAYGEVNMEGKRMVQVSCV
ncbi:hypothetical protein LSH36_284g03009, partial [Paralvinella palmiformis]